MTPAPEQASPDGRIRPVMVGFALLHASEAFCRSLLLAVLPVQALNLLGDAQQVSVLFFATSALGMLFNFAVPTAIHRIGRRWVYAGGGAMSVLAAYLLYLEMLPALVLGLVLQVWVTAATEIPLNLYVMDHVRRHEFGRFEPLRVTFVGMAWIIGPVAGPYLRATLGHAVPFALVGLFSVSFLALFWTLRLRESAPAVSTRPPLNPVRYIPRFVEQPRLRLAWFLALGRNCFWNVYFVYAPIYAVTSGLGEIMSGAIVSMGTLFLMLIPIWGWFGRRYGFRRILLWSNVGAGLFYIAAAAAAGSPWLGAALLVGSAFCGSLIDSSGNAHFLRAVRAYERPEMTAVFWTHRYLANLAPPGVFALALKVFELPAVFLGMGGALLVVGYYAHYLPRRF